MKIKVTIFSLLFLFPLFLPADPPTPSPDNSSTNTNIDVKVDKDTKEIKIINNNNDTKVVSKVYKLKYANPWDLKPVLQAAVGATRNRHSRTGVECIKYNDGTGAIIVSAEKYRFSKQQGGGMSIDELVASLDQPRAEKEPVDGMETMVYYPKHRDAGSIAKIINDIGIEHSSDSKAVFDRELNAVIIRATPSEMKTIKKMLGVYDKSSGQISLSYKVYELTQEDDEVIGNDYTAWKNGPGANLFSIGGRFTKGGSTKFVKFNPKWNSSFLDYLVKEKKAAALTNGTIVLKNGKKFSSASFSDSDKTGLKLLIVPSIHKKTSTLDMKLKYQSKTSSSSLKTKFQILNDGGKAIVGGLNKKSKVSSNSSPGILDWLLGDSSDSIKQSKLVVVFEVIPSTPGSSNITPEQQKVIDEVKKELEID